jgi:peptidoglycan/LPS O-acetylase OafA/YrhL
VSGAGVPAPAGAPAGRPLPRLTSLRAVAALAVFAFHLGRWDVLPQNPLPLGYVGVGFFFVLSGFILTWSAQSGTTARRFWWRRFARVYPLHLVTALAALALPVTAFRTTPAGVGANLALVQAWVPVEDVVYSLNGVSWSLSNEAAFYLAFPVLVVVLGTLSHRRRCLVAVAVVCLTVVVVVLLGTDAPAAVTAVYSHPLLRLSDFVLGVVAGAGAARGPPAAAVAGRAPPGDGDPDDLGGAALAAAQLHLVAGLRGRRAPGGPG